MQKEDLKQIRTVIREEVGVIAKPLAGDIEQHKGLLGALGDKLDHHSKILEKHTEILDRHEELLDLLAVKAVEHDKKFEKIDKKLIEHDGKFDYLSQKMDQNHRELLDRLDQLGRRDSEDIIAVSEDVASLDKRVTKLERIMLQPKNS